MPAPHVHPVSIYYEDTDFSGLVYHPNYLKYYERAREHILGRKALVSLYRDQGVGFVVYKCELSFREGAVFGDELEIRTNISLQSGYRAVFDQQVWRPEGVQAMVQGMVHMVCVDRENKLVKLPDSIREIAARYAP